VTKKNAKRPLDPKRLVKEKSGTPSSILKDETKKTEDAMI